MTCNYTNSNWLDVLYTSVRQLPGNVESAARYLSERRGRSITAQSLRNKLRGLEGESLSMEMADLLTELMQESVVTQKMATRWLQTYAVSRGLIVIDIPPPPAGGHSSETKAIVNKVLALGGEFGKLSGVAMLAVEDDVISPSEADELLPIIDEKVELLLRLKRNVIRAVEGG